MRRADAVHLLLLLAALGAAYLLPFELLLLSYAILGPAHYFTEISWLHDRKYFLPHRGFGAGLVALAFVAMFMAQPYWLGVLVWCVFCACAAFALAPSTRIAIIAWCGLVALTAAAAAAGLDFALIGILMPSLVHVCIFTLIFMTLGALKARSGVQGAVIGVYLVGLILILALPPGTQTVIPALARISQDYFGNVAPALGTLVGYPGLSFAGRVTGLLSFVYTYHYLNWFVKAEVIRWTAIPRPRLLAIVALSAASTAFYFIAPAIGILALLVISMMHVMLEFPLNGLAIRDLTWLLLGRKPARA